MIRGMLQSLMRPLRRANPAGEGNPHDGPWRVINPEGWLPREWGKYWNYWQMGYDPLPAGRSATVEACIDAYAQTIAMCPGDEWWLNADGGRERVTTSALSRILQRPNDYQSRSDFFLNLARDLYSEGNTYALAQRNDRSEVAAFHPFNPRQSKPIIGPRGEVFFQLTGNNVIEKLFGRADGTTLPGFSAVIVDGHLVVPARDVLHVKLEQEEGQPLLGVPPLRHAAGAIAAQMAIGDQLIKMFANMNRPPGVIETEKDMTAAQVREFRDRFNEIWQGVDNLGQGPPILTHGLKFHGISMTSKDSELTAIAKMTQDAIFMVYGVPPAILGMTDRASFSSTEALMQFWLARGLGFAINHIEVAFDHFFGLKGWPDNYVELDTRALLRVAYKDRIEGLARGVQTAIYTPNEARRLEDLPDKDGGDEPRVQQQQVPLGWGGFDLQPEPLQPPPPSGGEGEPPPPPANAESLKARRRAKFIEGEARHDARRAA